MISKKELQSALPEKLKISVTQDLVDKINNISADPLHAETIRENFITYTRVLQDGKYKLEDYMNAVAYVSYKLMGYNNQDSYFKTFPDRHAALVAKGASKKDISAYVAAYNKNKLVNAILEQSLIPIHILNQDAVQKAINTQIEIMTDESNPAIARTQAANSLLTHLVKKETAQVQLNIGTPETSGLKDLQNAITDLARQQKKLIESGITAKSIAESSIVDGEYERIN
ncbi:hypothetical protein ZC03_032 [Pseudomonas phage ZC03]|uniref:Uncharacterized protein n=2 Tax=Zicotriavirus TaxID=2843161 RepID=A0A1L2C938_9CAUD|nr:hypothetical protein HWA93_gp32 [Pseudomonas phage ZC03]YP_009830603.1 hypothetical protein HWA94_gp32 [Pseudomonas phage ZC08]AMD43419.1 hypothetical protein ZC03_032 [Pseudomonas phage ZC03]AMD43524.1 hypothetical protein ZC08_032 [Pseudomonas phage ZC08]